MENNWDRYSKDGQTSIGLFKPIHNSAASHRVIDAADHKETFDAVDDYPTGDVLPIEDEDGGDDDAGQEEG